MPLDCLNVCAVQIYIMRWLKVFPLLPPLLSVHRCYNAPWCHHWADKLIFIKPTALISPCRECKTLRLYTDKVFWQGSMVTLTRDRAQMSVELLLCQGNKQLKTISYICSLLYGLFHLFTECSLFKGGALRSKIVEEFVIRLCFEHRARHDALKLLQTILPML